MTQAGINRFVLFVIGLSLLPGYTRALLWGHVINVQAWGSVVVLLVLGGCFLARRQKSLSLLFMVVVFSCYSFVGYVRGGDSRSVIAHAFVFAPFIIAYLMLELRVGFDPGEAMFFLTLCAAAGAIAANVIQWFYPDTLAALMKDETNLEYIISLGRVSWAGYIITLPLVVQLGTLNIYSRKRRALVLACLPVIITGAALTFSRTLMIALLIMLGYFIIAFRSHVNVKGVAFIAGVGVGASYFVGWWSTINPSLRGLIDNRVLAFFSGTSSTALDVSIRNGFYSEYWDRLTHSYFLGQGLGLPVSTYLGPSNWADISLVSFTVPLGVPGLIVFFSFLKRVYRRMRFNVHNRGARRVLMLVFVLGLGISLNDDIWSHKYFPVYLVFILNSYAFGRAARPERLNAISSSAPYPLRSA